MTESILLPRGLEDFENDSRWFYENLNVLDKKFAGKFIAIKNKNVIASDKDIDVVVSVVEKQGENPAYILIEFVHPEGTVILL